MFGIDDALLGSAISAGGSILGGIMGGNAAGDAARMQSESAKYASDVMRQQANKAANMAMPYTNLGKSSAARLSMLLGLGDNGMDMRVLPNGSTVYDEALKQWQASHSFAPIDVNEPARYAQGVREVQDMVRQQYGLSAPQESNPEAGSLTRKFTQADLEADPVYQNGLKFGLDQGTGAINARAIANGGYDSGATLKALTRFGNDYGTTKAEGSYNRFTGDQNNTYNKLMGTTTLGANASAGVGNQAVALGQNQAGLATDIGNAQAAGIVGGANAMSNAFGGIGSAIQGYQNNSILKKILERTNGGYGSNYSTTGAGDIWGGLG